MIAEWTLIATLALVVSFGSACRIAVCLNGRVSTFLPEFRAESLLSTNADHSFYIFANLKQATKGNGTPADGREVNPPTINDTETTAHLQTMLRHHKHTTVVSVQIFQVQSRDPSRHFQLGAVTAINSLAAVLSNHLCLVQVAA
jgi:hypothetical protein